MEGIGCSAYISTKLEISNETLRLFLLDGNLKVLSSGCYVHVTSYILSTKVTSFRVGFDSIIGSFCKRTVQLVQVNIDYLRIIHVKLRLLMTDNIFPSRKMNLE